MQKRIPLKFLYPEGDGKPLAENTLQFEWIVTIKGGLDAQFGDDPNVFVAGDLFWYPVEGHAEMVQAPDVLVVFGRPKGHRGSYTQFVQAGVAPQVVWEVMSPGNRVAEMQKKFQFYERHGDRGREVAGRTSRPGRRASDLIAIPTKRTAAGRERGIYRSRPAAIRW